VNAWHLTTHTVALYRSAGADAVLAASVEAHLIGCPECRTTVATAAGPRAEADSRRRWDALAAEVDRPRRSPLARLGLSTPPLLAAWGVAVVLVFVVPVLPVLLTTGGSVPTLLLALAPVASPVAVALSYQVASDPAGELTLATPVAGLRLVAARALLVGVAAIPLGVAAAVVLDLSLALALAWLLPGLALSSVVLLAGTTRLDPAAVAAVLGTAWALAVATPSATRRVSVELVAAQVSSPSVQLAALAVALLCLALTLSRREQVTYRRTT